MCDKAHRSENNEQVDPIKIEGNGNIDQVSADSDYIGTKSLLPHGSIGKPSIVLLL